MSPDPSGKLGHEASDLDEKTFLKGYRRQEYPRPSVTVDLVIFTVMKGELSVLLIKRKGHPFQGRWALPGGFVDVGNAYEDQGEDLEHAAHRELAEETSLPEGSCFLEQLYTFGKAGRDPRTRVISVAYYALVPSDLADHVRANDDASDARWVRVSEIEGVQDLLAFDHIDILTKALKRIRGKIDYSPIALSLLPDVFTAADLQAIHQAVKGQTFTRAHFSRKFRRMLADGVLIEAGLRPTATKPVRTYKFIRRPT